MKKRINIIATVFIIGLLSLSFIEMLPPNGLDTPEPIGAFLNDNFPKKSPASGNWKLVNQYPNLTFIDPIAMISIPGEDAYLVAGKSGYIWHVSKDSLASDKTVVLNISNKVLGTDDAGMINMILHPEFGDDTSLNSRYLYVFYAYHPDVENGKDERMNRLSRFTVSEDYLSIDPSSELILIQDYDPQRWHMGGGMLFDEKGFLYLSFGDGGLSNDFYNSSQQIDKRFWGGVIRIDVDNDPSRSHPIRRSITEFPGRPDSFPASFTDNYMIPNDNPWIDEGGGVLEEFYSLGWRSPHRMTVDEKTGKIWIGDVGQGGREEVSIVTKGSNGGWPFREGEQNGPRQQPQNLIGEEIPPIYTYRRSQGNAIIGGFVYRGERWANQLEGHYIFGDHGSRNVWAFNPENSSVQFLASIPNFGNGPKRGISSFATNEEGDIFVLKVYGTSLDGGTIYRVELNGEAPEPIPHLLSETGAFSDLQNLTPASGVIPYKVNAPLWSDGALKKRWIAIKNDGTHDSPDEQVFFSEQDEWQFPNGTVFIKHFEMPMDINKPDLIRKLETRFFILDEDGLGYGLTYKWLEDGSDAELLSTSVSESYDIITEEGAQSLSWDYPSRTQCMSCHNANAGFVLGVNTHQLNGAKFYESTGRTANQLKTWDHLSIFSNPIANDDISTFPRAAALDEEISLQHKIMSYLDSNCSHCHRPDGVDGAFDARLTTPLAYKNIINGLAQSHNSPEDGIIVLSGHPESSLLWLRDSSLDEDKMPPLSKATIDRTYIDLLTEWIEGINSDCLGNFISDLPYQPWSTNGYGPIERDQANGDAHDEDGAQMKINGKEYLKGLGVHAYSDVDFDLERKYTRFESFIGVDDESCENASLRFEVWIDGKRKYISPIMKKNDEARFISIDVENAYTLKLIVDSPEDIIACDHANWADARLYSGKDSDGDGVCDSQDICPGADDNIDENFDGIPDGCEVVIEGGQLDMTVSPNPFTNQFQIFVEEPEVLIKKAKLFIYDINGRLMHQNLQLPYGYTYNVDASNGWAKGSYVVQVKAGRFSAKEIVIKY